MNLIRNTYATTDKDELPSPLRDLVSSIILGLRHVEYDPMIEYAESGLDSAVATIKVRYQYGVVRIKVTADMRSFMGELNVIYQALDGKEFVMSRAQRVAHPQLLNTFVPYMYASNPVPRCFKPEIAEYLLLKLTESKDRTSFLDLFALIRVQYHRYDGDHVLATDYMPAIAEIAAGFGIKRAELYELDERLEKNVETYRILGD